VSNNDWKLDARVLESSLPLSCSDRLQNPHFHRSRSSSLGSKPSSELSYCPNRCVLNPGFHGSSQFLQFFLNFEVLISFFHWICWSSSSSLWEWFWSENHLKWAVLMLFGNKKMLAWFLCMYVFFGFCVCCNMYIFKCLTFVLMISILDGMSWLSVFLFLFFWKWMISIREIA